MPRGWVARTQMHTIRLFVVFAVMVLLGVGCAKSEPPPPDEATLKSEDKRTLEGVIAIDVKTSQAMRDADEATSRGDAGAASGILSSRARPSADEAIAAAEGAPLKTEWGKAKRAELAGIFRDRQIEMPKYADAVKGDDPQKMLEAMEAQAAIERRALTTVAAVREER